MLEPLLELPSASAYEKCDSSRASVARWMATFSASEVSGPPQPWIKVLQPGPCACQIVPAGATRSSVLKLISNSLIPTMDGLCDPLAQLALTARAIKWKPVGNERSRSI